VGAIGVRRRLGLSAGAIGSNWRNRDLCRAQSSFAAAWTSEWAFTVGISVYAFRGGGGVTSVGVVSLLRMLPAALMAPVLSPYADRWRRDRVLAGTSGARAIATGAAAVLAATTHARIAVYVLAVFAAVAAVLFRPVHSALLPSLCRTPYELTSANVVRGMLDATAALLGPLLAAAFLATSGVSAVFAVSALASLASAVLMASLQPAAEAGAGPLVTTGVHLADGLRVVRRSRDLCLLIGLATVQTVIRGATTVFVVVLSIQVLHAGESGVGALTAAIGAGAVVGSLLTTVLVGTRRLARWFGLGVALWGLPLAVLAAKPAEVMALVLLSFVGVANTLVDIGLFTLIARRAPEQALAGVYGVLEGAIALGVAAGSLLAPLAIHVVGTRAALVWIGLLGPVAVLAGWWRLRAIDATVDNVNHEIDVLRNIDAFALLPLPAVERLARALESVTVAAGEIVFSAGDVADRYFLIEQGEADVIGHAAVVTTMGPGEGFGDVALLRRVPRTATVRARTDLQLLALAETDFLATLTSFRPSAAALSIDVDRKLHRYAPS